LAHRIGHSAAVRYGGDISAAFKFGDSVCWSGYYHGVVEQTIENMTDADLTARMSSICPIDATAANPYTFDRYNCVHGLGHGVTIRTKGDVFAALPFCDALTDGWDRSSCDGGVFMENIIEAQAGNADVSLKADDPVYPCNAVAESHKLQCYQMVTSNILWRNGYDYAAAFRTCDTVEAAYIGTCYRSMGRDISGGTLLDVPRTIELCNLGGEQNRLECILGAAANATLDRRDGAKSTELCDAVDPQYQQPLRRARPGPQHVLSTSRPAGSLRPPWDPRRSRRRPSSRCSWRRATCWCRPTAPAGRGRRTPCTVGHWPGCWCGPSSRSRPPSRCG
jgi:hypothetical protein